MRILIFHGYLLRGTGSNIYNANLARALAALGHEVHLFCQDRTAQKLDGVTIHTPDIGRILPVYVADRYEGFDALPFPQLDDAALKHYLDANVAAIRAAPSPDIALANHLVMGPVILARGLAGRAPYAVKVHGSALEYTVRPHPERFLPYALEGIRGASGVLVGSRHTAESLWEVLSDEPSLPERTRLGPPGVDLSSFHPRSDEEATIGLSRLADKLEAGETAAWGGDAGAAKALRQLDPSRDRIVSYLGKLIVSKGVDLLLRRLAVGGGARASGAAGGGRVWNVPAGAGPFRGRARPQRPGDAARDRKPGTRARGRPSGGAKVSACLP